MSCQKSSKVRCKRRRRDTRESQKSLHLHLSPKSISRLKSHDNLGDKIRIGPRSTSLNRRPRAIFPWRNKNLVTGVVDVTFKWRDVNTFATLVAADSGVFLVHCQASMRLRPHQHPLKDRPIRILQSGSSHQIRQSDPPIRIVPSDPRDRRELRAVCRRETLFHNALLTKLKFNSLILFTNYYYSGVFR